MSFDAFPGLRLEATASRRSWTYRFKSPVDGRMRQQKLGEWPAMAYATAIAEWQNVRARRDAGEDPVLTRRASNRPVTASTAESYTVRKLCEDFVTGHIERYRDSLGAAQSRRRIMKKIAPIAGLPAASITRKQAFDLLDGERQTPRNAAILRSELGAAWDYALDAGRIPEDSPNWWRQVMRGKLRSVGRKRGGKVENVKRVLSEDELATLVPWLSKLSETISDVLTMYLWTGLRGGEIVAMEGKEISKESDGLWWTIPKAKTKNKNRASATDQRAPLVGRVEMIVQRRLGLYGKGYLFPTADSRHIPQKSVQAVVWAHHPTRSSRVRCCDRNYLCHIGRRTICVARPALCWLLSGVRTRWPKLFSVTCCRASRACITGIDTIRRNANGSRGSVSVACAPSRPMAPKWTK